MKTSNFTIWIPIVGMLFISDYGKEHPDKDLIPIGLLNSLYQGVAVLLIIQLLYKYNIL